MGRIKKPRNKKYSPRKSFELGISRAVFISFTSESEHGDKVCVTNIETPALRDAVIARIGDWLIQMGVICQDDAGDYYCKETYMIARHCRINDVTDIYEAERDSLCDSVNPAHAIDFGWIIRPYSKRLERLVELEQEPTVFEKWQERKERFENQTMRALV